MKSGELDMIMTGVTSVDTRELWKVADTRTEHAALEFAVIANEKTWQSLTPAHRAIIMEAAKEKSERTLRDEIAAASELAHTPSRARKACGSTSLRRIKWPSGGLAARVFSTPT